MRRLSSLDPQERRGLLPQPTDGGGAVGPSAPGWLPAADRLLVVLSRTNSFARGVCVPSVCSFWPWLAVPLRSRPFSPLHRACCNRDGCGLRPAASVLASYRLLGLLFGDCSHLNACCRCCEQSSARPVRDRARIWRRCPLRPGAWSWTPTAASWTTRQGAPPCICNHTLQRLASLGLPRM